MKSKISFRAVIPNIITIFALILGLTSIKFTMTSDFKLAIISIVLAAILDAADGRNFKIWSRARFASRFC